MASFTTKGQVVSLTLDKDKIASVAISGTYDQVIKFQVDVGGFMSGTWYTVRTFDTANATEAYLFYAQHDRQRMQVLLATDAGGTATVTLTDVTGINTDVITNVTTSTFQVAPAMVGKVITLNLAAGIAVTLPAATGTGDKYTFVVGTTFTGASSIKVASSADTMIGTAVIFVDGGATVQGYAAATTDDTIDLLGTANSTGGILGETIELTDIASTLWHVKLVSDAGGTEASPFSATV